MKEIIFWPHFSLLSQIITKHADIRQVHFIIIINEN